MGNESRLDHEPLQPESTGEPDRSPSPRPERTGRVWRALATLSGWFGSFSREAITNTAELERQLLRSLQPSTWPTLRQLRHSYRIFPPAERRIMTGCFVVIVAASVWLGINQVYAHISITPTPGGSYTEGLVGEVGQVNPVFAAASPVDTDLSELVFSGLFRYNKEMQVTPDVARAYTVSNDGRVYTITIKENAAWHDGEPLTADDITFTFTSIANPDAGSPLASALRGVVVEKVDGKTVRFTLKEPYTGFLNTLTVGIIPEHIWAAIPIEEWRRREENLRPIGSGSWQFNSLIRDDTGAVRSYVLTKAPARTSPVPYLETLTFKLYPDYESAMTALQNHAIDGLGLISLADRRKLRSTKHITFYDLHVPAVTTIFFNLSQASPLQNVAVRRALRMGIDKRAIVEQVFTHEAAVARGALPVTSQTQLNTIIPLARYNEQEAQNILEQNGWRRLGAIRQNAKGETLNITLSIVDHEPDRAVGTLIQEQWRRLGVETKLDLISPSSPPHVTQVLLRPRAYQALLYTTVYGATLDPYPFWHSSQRFDPGLNFSLFSNREADSAIERIRRSLTETEQQEAYATLQSLMADQVPAVFLYNPTYFYAMSDEVYGVEEGSLARPADRFNSLARWYVNTQRHLK